MKREYRNRIRIIVCHKDVLFIREKVYIRGIAAADREHIQLREQAGLRISPEDTKTVIPGIRTQQVVLFSGSFPLPS